MRLFITILFFIALGGEVVRADGGEFTKKIAISGNITDVETGEDLIGATVFVKELKTGTSSNVYGFYSISLETGDYTLVFSYVGYEQLIKQISLTKETTINIGLKPIEQELEEVVVTSTALNDNVTRTTMSTVKMDVKTINRIPALMGEVDILKAIMLLPGVQTIAEGSSGFSVRGGSMDQNLIQLDEATVYNASHLMGFFSVFNNDAIKGVELYKGDIPASSGGRLSSLLDVRMRDGNLKKISGRGGIGTISSRLTLEGPILKDKASFLVSGRRTYADIFLKLFGEPEMKDNKIYFYDFNAKFNYRINNNNRIYVSGYYGRDIFKNAEFKMGWGNQTTSVRWNHLFSKKIFTNFTFLYSNFDYELGVPEGQNNSFNWKSNLKDYSGKADFTYYLNSDNMIRFGISGIYHKFKPGTARGLGEESIANELVVQDNQALESGIYLSNEQKVGARFTFKYGLRLSHFVNVGESYIYNFDENYKPIDSTYYGKGEFFSPYFGLEPRFGAVFLLNESSSIKASYSRTRQYVHLGQNSTAGTPFDVWFPSSPNVKPQLADQVALGYFRNFLDNSIEASAEIYYKKMKNSIDFKDHAELLLNQYFEGELRFGSAEAYGVELLANYHLKKFSGWVSYTYSKTTKTIEGINNGNPYPAVYDKPHNISIVFNYDISKRVTVGATWVYNTGSAVTFPTGRFVYGNTVIPIYSDRNGYRLPDYHRLDVSATLKSKEKPGRKWSHEWNFSVYNAYGRKNPWVINFKQEPNDPSKTYAEMIYLFSFVPAITFNFLF
ncbi:MAG: TonB-dependent receptor [Chlorobi bacterium]|nr:TonB-dependent receptor [Chlorobiota bacterium]